MEKQVNDICGEYDDIISMQKQVANLEGPPAERLQHEFEDRYNTFMEKVAKGSYNYQISSMARYTLDNWVAYRQDPPLLYWDRRRAEPLKANATEFFPKADLVLLDLQPRSLWPILQENFPKNYDVLEYILSNLLNQPSQTVQEGLKSLAPGAFESLVPECPSITDPKKGGNPHLDVMTVRCLTLEMLKELIEAWTKWPFRPTRREVLAKMGSEIHDNET